MNSDLNWSDQDGYQPIIITPTGIGMGATTTDFILTNTTMDANTASNITLNHDAASKSYVNDNTLTTAPATYSSAATILQDH